MHFKVLNVFERKNYFFLKQKGHAKCVENMIDMSSNKSVLRLSWKLQISRFHQ